MLELIPSWLPMAMVPVILGLPILIHLINLMRHRRIEWAAMEFVLTAYKKRSTWVLLKQLLLLLLRILALLAIIIILSRYIFKSSWNPLQGTRTHHVVMVDETLSMSDKVGEATALDRAKQALENVANDIANSPGGHDFTLLTFSGQAPLMNKTQVTSEFRNAVAGEIGRIQPTLTSSGPAEALDKIEQQADLDPADRLVVYVLSDFRAREWNAPEDLDAKITELIDQGAEVRLIRCVDQVHGNLTVTELKPDPFTLAANIEIPMRVAVKNNGDETENNVSVEIYKDGASKPFTTVGIDTIAPGRTREKVFKVRFTEAGKHSLSAKLPDDAVPGDNVRHAMLELYEGVPVLLVDQDAETPLDAYYLNRIFSPGQSTAGIAPEVVTPDFLRNNSLEKYQAVYLLNTGVLDEAMVEALEAYVASGGGLAIFLGERTSVDSVNEKLYREGEGVFPAPLAAPVDLLYDRIDKAPDMDPNKTHPIFKVFAAERDTFLSTVSVSRYFALKSRWQPDPQSTVKVISKLRNGDPLVLEHTFKNGGRVVVFLTSVAPVWNNWALANPSFVVAMLELQNYLAGSRWKDNSREVGGAVEVDIDPAEFKAVQHELFEPDTANPIRLQAGPKKEKPADPAEKAEPAADEEVKTVAASETAASEETPAAPTKPMLTVAVENTRQAGVYKLMLQRLQGKPDERWFVYNVNPVEGDLTLPRTENLKAAVNSKVKWQEPGETGNVVDNTQRSLLSEWVLYVLIILLIGEQILAYSASYHTAAPTAPVPAGRGAAGSAGSRTAAAQPVAATLAEPARKTWIGFGVVMLFVVLGATATMVIESGGTDWVWLGCGIGAGVGVAVAQVFGLWPKKQ